MMVNVHLTKKDIENALIQYVTKLGYQPEKDPLVTMTVHKGDARESEDWEASVCGCNNKP